MLMSGIDSLDLNSYVQKIYNQGKVDESPFFEKSHLLPNVKALLEYKLDKGLKRANLS